MRSEFAVKPNESEKYLTLRRGSTWAFSKKMSQSQLSRKHVTACIWHWHFGNIWQVIFTRFPQISVKLVFPVLWRHKHKCTQLFPCVAFKIHLPKVFKNICGKQCWKAKIPAQETKHWEISIYSGDISINLGEAIDLVLEGKAKKMSITIICASFLLFRADTCQILSSQI